MNDFLIGVFASIAATVFVTIIAKWIWPNIKDRCLYNGIRVDGAWDIIETRNGNSVNVGRIKLNQQGRIIKGISTRTKTRDGKKSERTFNYNGFVNGNQVTLIFEDAQGIGFDTGTYVFIIHNDVKTMVGMATFNGKTENKIVSEPRTLSEVV